MLLKMRLACLLAMLMFSMDAQSTESRIDISQVANRDFVDQIAGDGGGGWSDQGPDNSLTTLKPGTFHFEGMEFSVIDPSTNSHRAILAFPRSLAHDKSKPVEISAGKNAPENGGSLNLLHTACWADPKLQTTVGTIKVLFDSGKILEFNVDTTRDISDWWNPSDQKNANVAFRENNKAANVGLFASRFVIPQNAGKPISLQFNGTGMAIWIIVAATWSEETQPLPREKQWTVCADNEWGIFDQTDSEVKKDSALDLSTIFRQKEAGINGFSQIDSKGRLVFENNPGSPLRILCHSTAMATLSAKTPEEINRYAEQIARAGYNAFRPHFLDVFLMQGANRDLEFNPDQLDRWDRLASALKKQGIYLYIDAMTSWTSFFAVYPWNPSALPQEKTNMKTRLYYDETARAHWKEGVRKLFQHVNPYTGLALADDPQVVAVQLRNEASLSFAFGKTGKSPDRGLIVSFRNWLTKRYGTTAELKKAWSRQEDDAYVCYLKSRDSIQTVDFPDLYGTGPDSQDMQMFFTETEQDTFKWLSKTIREIGVHVPVTDFNNTFSIQSLLTRSQIDLVDNHTYHDHPTDYDNQGSATSATSSISGGMMYFNSMATTRLWGRPFICSEWGAPFWGPYRYESGISFPSYASLQGWQMLTQFSDPVGLEFERPIRPFQIWKDPPLKAAEYMAAFLYRRGDIVASPHRVTVPISLDKLSSVMLQDAISPSLTKVALLSGLGYRVQENADKSIHDVKSDDVRLEFIGGAKISTQEGAQTVASALSDSYDRVNDSVAILRSANVLTPSNRTDPANGIYESDTGQLLLNERTGQLLISSSLSQGATFVEQAQSAHLKFISFSHVTPSSSILTVSLDGASILESDRMLFIVASDALNSGMVFSDPQRRTLVKQGNWPVLIRGVTFSFSLKNSNPDSLKMWALAANGKRVQEIPLSITDEGVSATINTSGLTKGPTPYFEIARTQTPPQNE